MQRSARGHRKSQAGTKNAELESVNASGFELGKGQTRVVRSPFWIFSWYKSISSFRINQFSAVDKSMLGLSWRVRSTTASRIRGIMASTTSEERTERPATSLLTVIFLSLFVVQFVFIRPQYMPKKKNEIGFLSRYMSIYIGHPFPRFKHILMVGHRGLGVYYLVTPNTGVYFRGDFMFNRSDRNKESTRKVEELEDRESLIFRCEETRYFTLQIPYSSNDYQQWMLVSWGRSCSQPGILAIKKSYSSSKW